MLLSVKGLGPRGIERFDLEMKAKECAALLGPSGSGKSLLLRAIADLDPHEGQAYLEGGDRVAMPAHEWRRQVMYVAAESGWWADGVAAHFDDVAAAMPLIEALGLPGACATWPVARLSTGEKQRLALARALSRAPKILLLDEPTSGLDADAAMKAEALIASFLAKGGAVLMVTHDPAQAARLAGRILRIESGRLIEGAVP